MATVLEVRRRWGIDYDDLVIRDQRGQVVRSNQDVGHTLGRLRMLGDNGISEKQYHTGMSYGQLVRRHAGIMGYSLDIKSPGFELVSRGESASPQPHEDVILKMRKQFSDCYRFLMDACKDHGMAVATQTYDACLDRLTYVTLPFGSIGNIRIGLNALGKVLQ